MRPAYTNFDELTFVDEKLKVVLASCSEDLGTDGSFETTALFGGAYKPILI